MASALRKLTGVGGDVRKIAALLQKKAPPGHKLAYINDEEAALLKSRGGSGKPHADTGIPSFNDEGANYDFPVYNSSGVEQTPEQVAADNPKLYYGGEISPQGTSDVFVPVGKSAPAMTNIPSSGYSSEELQNSITRQTTAPGDISQAPRIPSAAEAFEMGKVIPSATPTGTPEESLADKLSKGTGLSKDTLGRLGLAGGLGLLGTRTAKQAAASGQAGAQQIQSIAAPYQQQGAALQAQAQRGELTPAAQQSLQAIQAQAAQAAQSRGGVGSQQTQAQVEAYRQQLLAQQYDYGLKLSGIGDNIALGAIKTGLEADRYVQQLNNSFYTNMAYIASGMSPGIRLGGAT